LGYNIENIKGKVATLETIFKLYDIKVETHQFIEKNLSLLGTKIDKIWIIARMLKTLDFNPSQITETFLSRLLFSNITDTTVVASLLKQEIGKNFTTEQVIKAIKEAKKIPKDQKNEIIKAKTDSKLTRRYERGYGK